MRLNAFITMIRNGNQKYKSDLSKDAKNIQFDVMNQKIQTKLNLYDIKILLFILLLSIQALKLQLFCCIYPKLCKILKIQMLKIMFNVINI